MTFTHESTTDEVLEGVESGRFEAGLIEFLAVQRDVLVDASERRLEPLHLELLELGRQRRRAEVEADVGHHPRAVEGEEREDLRVVELSAPAVDHRAVADGENRFDVEHDGAAYPNLPAIPFRAWSRHRLIELYRGLPPADREAVDEVLEIVELAVGGEVIDNGDTGMILNETSPLLSYLVGFSIMQYAIIVGISKLLQMLADRSEKLHGFAARFGGISATAVGALFLGFSLT